MDMGWRVVDPELLRPRTIELLEYPGDHSASLGWHQDTQSAVTVLLMMSDQNEYEEESSSTSTKVTFTPLR